MTSSVSARTYPLGVGTLAIGTSGYSVTGLLPAISTQLNTSPAVAGQLFTVFAATCAISGPVIAVATNQWERRRLLVAALVVTSLGNALAAVAPSLPMLVAARMVTALGTAVYTAAAVATAAEINRTERQARAMAVVFGGLTLALLLGVPASSALSTLLGYRGVFGLLAGLCGLGAALIAIVVPAVAAPAAANLRDRLRPAADRPVLAVCAMALLATMSTFTVYTYAAALLATTTEVRGATASLLLAGYGIGAATGNALGGRAADRYGPRPALLVATGTCTVVLLMLPVAATTAPGAGGAFAVWGCAFWSINAPVSTWLIRLAPARSHVLLSLVGAAIYLGMALGGLLGGAVVSWAGTSLLGPISASMSAAACAVLLTPAARQASSPADDARRDAGTAPVLAKER